MSNLLKDKVAIVTGGSRGIGKAIAQRFAQEGCNLVLVSRTKSDLEKTAESIIKKFSVNVSVYPTDIANENEVVSMTVSPSNHSSWMILIRVYPVELNNGFKGR